MIVSCEYEMEIENLMLFFGIRFLILGDGDF